MKKNKTVFYIATGAMFTAIIMVLTSFLHIPTGINGGYIHVGDAFIYLAASFLPFPLSIIVSATGSALADLILGGTLWILPTFVIKGLMAACFSNKSAKFLSKRNIIALPIALVILCGGYYLAETLIFGELAALVSVLLNAVQGIASSALYILIAVCLDKAKLKTKLQ